MNMHVVYIINANNSGVHIGFFVCNVLPGVLGYQCFMAKCGRKRAINYDRKIIYIKLCVLHCIPFFYKKAFPVKTILLALDICALFPWTRPLICIVSVQLIQRVTYGRPVLSQTGGVSDNNCLIPQKLGILPYGLEIIKITCSTTFCDKNNYTTLR